MSKLDFMYIAVADKCVSHAISLICNMQQTSSIQILDRKILGQDSRTSLDINPQSQT